MHFECLSCQSFCFSYICSACESHLIPYKGCGLCYGQCFCPHKSYALFEYSSVKSLILKLKYSKQPKIADLFAQLSLNLISSLPVNPMWTCIPTSTAKILARGYNTSLVLCKAFQNLWGGTIDPFLLEFSANKNESTDKTDLQRFISASDLHMASLESSSPTNIPIIIVDDVISSGSTLQAAIRAIEHFTCNITCIAIGKR